MISYVFLRRTQAREDAPLGRKIDCDAFSGTNEASRSAFFPIGVGIPRDKPGQDLSVPCFNSLTDPAPVVGNGQIWSSSPCITKIGTSICARSS